MRKIALVALATVLGTGACGSATGKAQPQASEAQIPAGVDQSLPKPAKVVKTGDFTFQAISTRNTKTLAGDNHGNAPVTAPAGSKFVIVTLSDTNDSLAPEQASDIVTATLTDTNGKQYDPLYEGVPDTAALQPAGGGLSTPASAYNAGRTITGVRVYTLPIGATPASVRFSNAGVALATRKNPLPSPHAEDPQEVVLDLSGLGTPAGTS